MTNYSWVGAELRSRGYTSETPEGDVVYRAINEVFNILDAHEGLDDDLRKVVLEQALDLSSSAYTSTESLSAGHAKWHQFHLGDAPVGAVVRVKKNAYTSTPGRRYNGLVGHLIAGRGGRAVVRFIGRRDTTGHYLDPINLQVLR